VIFNANRINRWFLNSAAPLSFRQFPILLLQFPYRCGAWIWEVRGFGLMPSYA